MTVQVWRWCTWTAGGGGGSFGHEGARRRLRGADNGARGAPPALGVVEGRGGAARVVEASLGCTQRRDGAPGRATVLAAPAAEEGRRRPGIWTAAARGARRCGGGSVGRMAPPVGAEEDGRRLHGWAL